MKSILLFIREIYLRLRVILFPKFAKNHYDLGHFLVIQNKKLDMAENELRQAIELNPNNYKHFLTLAYILHTDGKFSEAIDYYQLAINKNPLCDNAYFNIGCLFHEKLNRFDEAKQAYQKAMEINPENPDTYFQIGWLLVDRLHNYEEAESMFNKTLELNPQDETALYNLACIKSNNRDLDSTFAYLQEAIDKGFDREWARKDKDFEWLQNDLRFIEIIGLRPSGDN